MFDILNGLARKWRSRNLGLLLIRIAAGIVFFMHGWQKLNGLPGVEGFFMQLGLPGWVALFIAWLEVIGGIALILGIFTRFFAVAFGIEMLVAIFLTGIGRGYQAHEFELVLMLLSFGIAFAGSGRFSLYPFECQHCGAMICRDPNCPGHK